MLNGVCVLCVILCVVLSVILSVVTVVAAVCTIVAVYRNTRQFFSDGTSDGSGHIRD